MQIQYCETCNRRITEHDLEVGQAAAMGEQVYCKACLEKMGLQIPPMASRKRPPTGVRLSISPGSGIPRTSSGSGLRGVAGSGSGLRGQPGSGSGIRGAGASGSGIQKKPGSGLRQSPAPGSGIQKKPGSGLRPGPTPGSGIQGALPGAPRRSSSGSRLRTPGASDIQSAARSGIRTLKGGEETRPSASRLRPLARRRQSQVTQGDSGLWASVLGILIGLLLCASIFWFWPR